jgi:hypothetical protein
MTETRNLSSCHPESNLPAPNLPAPNLPAPNLPALGSSQKERSEVLRGGPTGFDLSREARGEKRVQAVDTALIVDLYREFGA